jgi:glutamine synthetase
MIEMAEKQFIPAMSKYSKALADTVLSKKAVISGIDCTFEEKTLTSLSALTAEAYAKVCELKEHMESLKVIKKDFRKASFYIKDEIIPCMNALRKAVDSAETICATEYWPVPTYGEILFSVK